MLAVLHLLDLDAALREQGARLRLHAEFAQSGAGIVIGDGAVEFAARQLDLRPLDEEIGQLVHAFAQTP